MFRLDDKIKIWRKGYESDLAFSEDDIDELESHLRHAFERNVQEGLTEQEAFEAAVSVLGHRKVLRKEYNNAKPAGWIVFGFLRALYLIVSLISLAVAQVYMFKTGYAPSFLYSTNIHNGLSVFALIAWWLPALTIFMALTFIKHSVVRLSIIIMVTLLILGYMSAPYQISSFVYDNESLFRTSFLILAASLFFRDAWAWRLTVLITGVYFVLVSGSMVESVAVLFSLPLDSILIVLVTTIGDPIIGLFLGYALFRQKQRPVAIPGIATD